MNSKKKILEQIKQALPVEFDAINYREISNTQGKSLAKTILEKRLYAVYGELIISRTKLRILYCLMALEK